MAILNVTPDSFSGDGLLGAAEAEIVARARAAEADGAHILDIGGESTRPGHTPVSVDEELARVLPVVRAIAAQVTIPISIDTYKAVVAQAALAAGAEIINDVRGLTGDPEMAALAARAAVPLVIMHDIAPDGRGDVVSSIVRELARRIERALAAGVAWEQIIIDPGFGFGKEWRENLELLRRLGELRALGRPILTGMSRKRTIGHVLGLPPEERLEGTAATVAIAIANGADIVRVHDTRAMARVARMTDAIVRGAPR
jgi:dihydropteroate synthase